MSLAEVAEPRNNGTVTPRTMPVGRPFTHGNPGRPKGSRNKLGEAFLEALHQDFKANGAAAIEQCRIEQPAQYLKVIAAILPEQIEITKTEFVVVVPAKAESVEEWLSQSGVSRRLNAP